MKASALLTAIQAQIAAALPTWTVNDTVAHDPQDDTVDMQIDQGSGGGFVFGALEISEVVQIRFWTGTTGGTSAAYRTAIDTRDAVTQLVMSAAFITALSPDVLLFEDGTRPAWRDLVLVLDGREDEAWWEMVLSLPVKRRLG